MIRSVKVVELEDGTRDIEIEFPFDEEILNIVRTIPGRRWIKADKVWTVPLVAATDVKLLLDRFGFTFDEEIERACGNIARQDRAIEVPVIEESFWKDRDHEFKTVPYKHQAYGIKVALEQLAEYGCHAYLWEMGTGKTMAALNVCKIMFNENRIKKVLVICPASLMDNWVNEIQKHTHYRASILYGPRWERKEALSRHAEFYIINYEYVSPFIEDLTKAGFDLAIADESTRIKTPSAKMSRAAGILGRSIRYKMIMTGTPITQSPADAFSQYRFMNEGIFGYSFVNFRGTFCIMGGYGGYSIVGFKNKEMLRRKIETHSTRFLKKDCLDLPDKTFEDYPVEMEKDQQDRYDAMASMILREIEDEFGDAHRISAPIVLTKLLRLSQITGGHLRSVDGTVIEFGSAKDAALNDLLTDLIYNGNKVIIWCRFVPEIHKVTRYCKGEGFNPAVIYGDVPMFDRDDIVQKFQKDPSCKVFIGQIGTAGFGINLTAASTAIYYSVDYSLEHYLQSQDRNHRIGVESNKVTYVNIFCKRSIDQAIHKALSRKKQMANEVTGDDVYSMIYGG